MKGDVYDGDCELGLVCTCNESCPSDCRGECGCEACRAKYNDFLSCDYG